MRQPTFVVLLAIFASGGAGATELSNLDSGLPNTLDDAFALRTGRIELQSSARYDRLRGGRDAVRLLPRVQVGIADGLQADIGLPYTTGSGRQTDPADLVAGVLYNLNREQAGCRPWRSRPTTREQSARAGAAPKSGLPPSRPRPSLSRSTAGCT
ncbi:MAG: hypothetical protein ACRYF2_18210 [Janthinobacterium lividum]